MPVIIAEAVWNNFVSFQGHNALGANRYLAMFAKFFGLLFNASLGA